MKRTMVSVWNLFSASAIAVGWSLAPASASAQEVVIDPDPAYIAAAQPVYFNGTPCYWFRDRWYYRSPAGWGNYYGPTEPAYLHDYRFRAWHGGVYHPAYHYGAGYHGGYYHRR
jgi:hypothetical protein